MALVDLKSNLSTAFKKAPVDVFPDKTSGAKGFTENFTDSNQSQFIGIEGRQYTYPTAVVGVHRNSVMEVSTANSKFDYGIAKLSNQLGNGSPFHFLKAGGARAVKKFSVTGYSAGRTYSSVAGSESILGAKATEQNSPSALEEQYKKFSLRDESYNPTYMRHPLIVRGIQRKGNEKPQYWGFGSKSGFDDGLIRGGAVTVADRIVADTVRIAKFMASPKGLLWVVKQIGLGLTNAKVEAVGGPFTRQTRIHSGVASLLSVPGTALGLHFTRHGLPFLNETASYENVIRIKSNFGLNVYSRLIDLQNEFKSGEYQIKKVKNALDNLSRIKTKSIGSTILSGLAGAQSVYGIGYTTIRRASDTTTDAVKRSEDSRFTVKTTSARPYVSSLRAKKTSVSKDTLPPGYLPATVSDVDSDSNSNSYTNIKQLWKNSVDDIQDAPAIYNPAQNSSPNVPASTVNDVTKLIDRKTFSDTGYYAGSLRAQTDKTFDATNSTTTNATINEWETANARNKFLPNLYTASINLAEKGPKHDLSSNFTKDKTYKQSSKIGAVINNYITLAYNKIPNKEDKKTLQDFRTLISGSAESVNREQIGILGTGTDGNYYQNNNLEKKYGFGKLGMVGADRTDPNAFLVKSSDAKTFGSADKKNRFVLSNNVTSFRGDKITAIDRSSQKTGQNLKADGSEVYPDGTTDLIEFYFEDGDIGYSVMPFRATITGLSDSFSPGWNAISIMGRPDGAYLYSSFERSLSFTFTVAALSRSEMIPMWRKLNYLASYTMPDFNATGGRPNGPLMRLTLGDMFKSCPGFLESLTYTVPDDATWDIAADRGTNKDAKQLPMMIEASVTYKVIHDQRPQLHGQVYYLNDNRGGAKAGPNPGAGNWLPDYEGGDPKAYKNAADEDPTTP